MPLPTMDEIELFFWQIYGSEHPPLSQTMWQTEDENISYYEVAGHEWLHSVKSRSSQWVVAPVYFGGYERPLQKIFVEAKFQSYEGGASMVHSQFTLPDDNSSDTNWTDLLNKSMNLPIFFRVTNRSSPIDVWMYHGLILIIEKNKLMLITKKLLNHWISIGMMNGRYVGYYALPNSTFINFTHAKLQKTTMQEVNIQYQMETMEKVVGE